MCCIVQFHSSVKFGTRPKRDSIQDQAWAYQSVLQQGTLKLYFIAMSTANIIFIMIIIIIVFILFLILFFESTIQSCTL